MIKLALASLGALSLLACGKQSASDTQAGSEVKYVRPLTEPLVSPVEDPLDYRQWCALKNPPEGVGRALGDIIEMAQFVANERGVSEDQIPWTCLASYEFLMNEKRIVIGSGIETVWPLVAFKNAEVVNVSGNVLKDLRPLTLMPKLRLIYAQLNREDHDGGRYPLTCPSTTITCRVDLPM